MTKNMRVTKTQRKWWVLSKAHHSYGMDQGHEISYTDILAVCKTKKEAKKLREQNEKFRGASIDSAPEYMYGY